MKNLLQLIKKAKKAKKAKVKTYRDKDGNIVVAKISEKDLDKYQLSNLSSSDPLNQDR